MACLPPRRYDLDFSNTNRVLTLYVPEILTGVGSLAYLLHFFYRLYRVKKVTKTFRTLFRDTWVIIDMVLLATLILTYVLRLLFAWSDARQVFSPFPPPNQGDKYRELSALASQYSLVFVIDAFTVLVLVFKALKFFSLQKDMMLLQRTLGQAISDLGVFMLMLLFLFIGFVIMGLTIFGMQAQGFKSFSDTLGTLFLILLGEFDYDEMSQVSPIWALMFFVFFVIFMFFIVLNIFLAILNDAYTTTRALDLWKELERRKPLSLREKFEVKKAQWRERKNIKRMKKMKKQRIKDARKARKEYDKKLKERSLLDRISKKKKKEDAAEEAAAGGGTSSTREGGGPPTRKAHAKTKVFS